MGLHPLSFLGIENTGSRTPAHGNEAGLALLPLGVKGILPPVEKSHESGPQSGIRKGV